MLTTIKLCPLRSWKDSKAGKIMLMADTHRVTRSLPGVIPEYSSKFWTCCDPTLPYSILCALNGHVSYISIKILK